MIKNRYLYLRLHLRFKVFGQCSRAQEAIKIIAFCLTAAVCLPSGAATRLTVSGVVTRVVDGDTLWVKTGAGLKPLKVRIQGIDAPEICQAGGLQARDALKGKVWGQTVTVTSGAHDDYGRTLATVHVQGQDIGRWMVSQGHAWVYSYRTRKALYGDEMAQAQGARRGVFGGGVAEEPRVFRKRYGQCERS